jgi:hypothetical protein
VRVTAMGNTDTKIYRGLFTSPPKNDATQYTSKTARAPSTCSPSGAFLGQDGGLF